jgi:preprotein translocase subunit SecG
MGFVDYVKIAMIVIATCLVGLVMLQARNGGLGDMFGGENLYRTRRGVEKTVFDMTVVFAGLFLLLAFLSVKYSG